MTTNNEKTLTRNSILIHSESYTELLEQKKKEHDSIFKGLLSASTFMLAIVLLLPGILAVLDDKKFSDADSFPLPVYLIVIALSIMFWVCNGKMTKAFSAQYNQYQQYCATEVLVVEDSKIVGATSNRPVSLTYDEIAGVYCSPSTSTSDSKTAAIIKAVTISNNILIIKDNSGNRFLFYSFKNCKEIRTIINSKLQEKQNDKE